MGISASIQLEPLSVELPSLSRVSQSTAVFDWSKSSNVGKAAMDEAVVLEKRIADQTRQLFGPLGIGLKFMKTSFRQSG